MGRRQPLLFLWPGKERRTARVRLLKWLATVATLLALSSPALALTSAEVAARVQRQYGGQVLDIQSIRANNTAAYRVKLLQPSGRVKLLLIDADSGRPLSKAKKKTGRD